LACGSVLALLRPDAACAQSLNLAEGRYVASTNPESEAKIALDAAAIKETDNLDTKKDIYQNGQNSQYQDPQQGQINRSLASLSLKSKDIMMKDDWYNIFRYSFEYIGDKKENEAKGNFDDEPIEQYGNTIVMDLFDLNEEDIETEAALVMNVWMTVVHHLQEAEQKCKASTGGNSLDGETDLDVAAAYYVGWGQVEGDNDSGHLLYNLAENAGARFGKDEGETAANKNVLDLMNQIKTEIITKGTCPNDHLKFRSLVRQIVSQMTVPLVQNLIHYMSERKTDKLELYALALTPQISSCDTAGYDFLLDKLVLNTYDPSSFADVIERLQGLYSCLGITCADVGAYQTDEVAQCNDAQVNGKTELAGYDLAGSYTDDVKKAALFDRDLLRMKNLMSVDALRGAKDVYDHGFNSPGGSLSQLSIGSLSTMKDDAWYNVYRYAFGYIGTNGEGETAGEFDDKPVAQYADTVVNDLFQLNREGIETEAASVMNVWMASVHHLQEAAKACKGGKVVDVGGQLDLAAAYWIGSNQREGDNANGRSLYHLTENAAARFGRDGAGEPNDVARANSQILSLLDKIQSETAGAGAWTCPNDYPAFRAATNEIVAQMTVPLVQNLIHYLAGNKGEKLELYSLAVAPQIASCDGAAFDYLLDKLVLKAFKPAELVEVVGRIQGLYSCLGITCEDVGAYSSEFGNVPQCDDNAVNKQTDLAGYALTSSVGKAAYYDRDLLRMKNLMSMDALEASKDVYKHGFNVPDSLASLSLASLDKMKDDDYYNIYRWSFNHIGVNKEGEDQGFFDDRPIEEYANTVVEDLYDLNKEGIETEAAMVMNVWMSVVNHLEEAGRQCKSGGTDNAVVHLDEAAALWIGGGQATGDNKAGRLLYHLTENAAAKFGKDAGPNAESEANKNILALLGTLKGLAGGADCSSQYEQFRSNVNKLVSQMNVPLVQNLIHYLSANRPQKLELYALALTPQIATCDPDAYEYFLEKLVLSAFDPADLTDVIGRLQALYNCLGIACVDVGAYDSDFGKVAQCQDSSEATLAGFALTYMTWPNVAYMDRDILRMKHLTGMHALNAAKETYMYGFNVDDHSLQKLATDADRSLATSEYPLFVKYFGDDNDYADTMILNAFNKLGPFSKASDGQVSELVVRASQSMVMYMHALQELYNAQKLCSSDESGALAAWDRGASSLIGSIEGADVGGSQKGGRFLFGLAKEMCGDFQVCPTGSAEVNEDMIDALTAGKNRISSGTCGDLLAPLEPLIKVPNVQGTLHFAALNAMPSVPVGSEEPSVASAHALFSSIAPLVDDSVLPTLQRNMNFDLEKKPAIDGADAVFQAVASSLGSLGVDCEKIGVYTGVDDGDLCVLLGKPPVEIAPTVSPPTIPSGDDEDDDVPFPPPGLGYQFTTGAEDHAYIAYDVKGMQGSNTDSAESLYKDGGNAEVKDAAGDDIMLSLEKLSTGSRYRMGESILYNFYRYSFKDEPVFIENSNSELPDSSYANTVVKKAFDVAQDKALAAEASVVMTLYMEIAHQLELAVKFCGGGGNGERAIDIAVAFWVGAGQTKGDNDSGYLLYNIAETAGERFGQDSGNSGEAAVNTKIMGLFNSAKQLAGSCTTDASQVPLLQVATQNILAQMNIPLLQNLVYYMNVADSDTNDYENYIELYALSIVPQVAACSPSTFSYLKDELIDYDWDRSDIGEIASVLEDSLSCFGVTCDDIGTLQAVTGNVVQPCAAGVSPTLKLAGYSASSDVTEVAKIDRDILQINITMQMEAFDAAKDIYTNGRNSRKGDSFMSLHQLAMNADKYDLNSASGSKNPLDNPFKLFSDFYGKGTYAADIINDAFGKSGRFSGAKDDQVAEVVLRTLQSMVTVMYSLSELLLGVEKCLESGIGKHAWDMGAAALIGSIEGTDDGGSSGGHLMYALAKETCEVFDTCGAAEGANANAKLIAQLSGGLSALQANECENARSIVTDQIIPTLEVSMIQSVLDSAVLNSKLGEDASNQKSLGSGYVLGQALLPFVHFANETSASTLETNTAFDRQKAPVPGGIDAVFDALAGAVPGMGVDCEAVGNYDNNPARGVCRENHSGTDVSILSGAYVTTTYVKEHLNIALDIKAMEQALELGNPQGARIIYKDGLNSVIYNKKGTRVGLRSLGSFSTSAALTMRQEPVFNMMTYGLEDENGLYLGNNAANYADTIVEAAFANTNVKTLASEAAVALNLWGYVVHELHQMADNCKNKRLTDEDGVLSLDEAAAYYIGDRQQSGDASPGHALYALAEKMGEKFKTDPGSSTHSTVNAKVLSYFNDAKFILGFHDACVNNPDTYPRLRSIIHKILSQMTVPLIQGLIYNLRENDRDRVKLYAQAVVPLIAGCNPSLHAFLKESLITSNFNVVKTEDYIEALQSVYSCLGVTCEDVGVYQSGAKCQDTPTLNPMAGYVPKTDVRKIATLDLDILHANIFMKKKAYSAVKDIYSFGKHAFVETLQGEELLSLEQLARTSARDIVPSFSYFKRFFEDEFDNDANAKIYGHYFITRALDEGEIPMASQEQRREMVTKSLQYMVGYMAALQYMYEAVDDCESNDSGRQKNAASKWDQAAALLIGSLEGAEDGGTVDGMMMHNLANKRCQQFGRCNSEGNAIANDELMILLYAGRGETESSDGSAPNCPALKKTVGEVESLLQVGLVQGTLRYALANQEHQFFVKDGDIAEGYIFSRSILPYVSESDATAGDTIARNMDFGFVSKPVQDGAMAVFNAFATALPGMGVDCASVGRAGGMDVCSVGTRSDADRRTVVSALSTLLVSLASCYAIL